MDNAVQCNIFHDVLWAAMRRFQTHQKIKKHFRCRVTILTCNDMPCGTNMAIKQRALKKAEDMGLSGYGIEVFNTNRSQNPLHNDDGFFKSDKFYNELLDSNKSGLGRFAKEEKFDIDLSASNLVPMRSKDAAQIIVKQRYHSKRQISSCQIRLNEINIGIKCYRMFVKKLKPTASSKLSRETNEELTQETNWMCESTGESLQAADIQLYHVLGNPKEIGDRVNFEKQAITKIKNSHPLDSGVSILGFKPMSTLIPYHQVNGSYFLYPDEGEYKGSTKAFTALHTALLKKRYYAMAMFRPNRNTNPRLAAIVAQPSMYRKTQVLRFEDSVPMQKMLDKATSEGDNVLVEMESNEDVFGFVLHEKVPGDGNRWKVEIQQGPEAIDLKFQVGEKVFLGDNVDAEPLPLLEVEDVVSGDQIQPAGLQAITMPWANEIRRDLKFMTNPNLPKANDILIQPMEEIIESFSLDPFKVGQLKNPNITKFSKGLQALASGGESTWNDKDHDNLLPVLDFEQTEDFVEIISTEIRMLKSKRKASTSTAATQKRSRVTPSYPENWSKLFAKDEVKKQTVSHLKKFLNDRGYDTANFRKSQLVEKVNKILSQSLSEEMHL